MRLSAALLFMAGGASAFVSDWFVHGLQPTIDKLHISQAFAGLVIVAIAGNAVENVTGIVLAYKGRSELAISVVKNSVAQIAAFLYPLLVLVSLLTATTLTFSLAPVYIGALLGTAVIVWQITGDGEATAFEGAALIATFVVLAAVAAYRMRRIGLSADGDSCGVEADSLGRTARPANARPGLRRRSPRPGKSAEWLGRGVTKPGRKAQPTSPSIPPAPFSQANRPAASVVNPLVRGRFA